MKPHYWIQLLLTFHALGGARKKHKAPLKARRKEFERGQRLIESKPLPLFRVEQQEIPFNQETLSLRLYYPGENPGERVILYFFCGGFIIGSLNTGESIARRLAVDTDSLVVAVDYPLAPENPYPGAVNAGYTALEWIMAGPLKSKQIYVAGDSSGGNLAAVTVLKARDKHLKNLSGQILIYPCLNFTFTEETYRIPGWKGYICTPMDMELFRRVYLPDPADWSHPYASPLLEKNLKNLPPTLMITAECDILRQEALDYAARLKDAGNEISQYEEKGVMHGYMNGTGLFHTYVDRTMEVIRDFVRME